MKINWKKHNIRSSW